VFWTGPNLADETHLYMRDAATEETIELDEGLTGEPLFQLASADGSRAFFADEGHLYECRFVEDRCARSDLADGLQGVVTGASEDGEWVYFVANAALAPGAVAGTCNQGSVEAGTTCNLYVRHDGETKLIAVVSSEDDNDWGLQRDPALLPALTARVSPDGQWLAFVSHRSLTGYDNRDAVSGKPDQEVYLYDARTGRVACASCNPTAARPVGEEFSEATSNHLVFGRQSLRSGSWLSANVPGWTPFEAGKAFYQSRYLSNSGRLFFNSRDSLVPQDTNGTWDVYEYEPSGVGSCTSEAAGFSAVAHGCVGLISGGDSDEESVFFDASATGGRDDEGDEGGGDVFFLTSAPLSSADVDTARDVYDAHECTSASPCLAPPPAESPVCSTSETCRAAPATQPAIFWAPASMGVSGASNLAPPPPPPASKPASKPSAASQRAARLRKALRSCRAKRDRRKRRSCESQARRQYGPSRGKKATRAGATARPSATTNGRAK
jgi:hypothetical protein